MFVCEGDVVADEHSLHSRPCPNIQDLLACIKELCPFCILEAKIREEMHLMPKRGASFSIKKEKTIYFKFLILSFGVHR